MNNKEILKSIDSLDIKETKKLFNSYLDKTKKNIILLKNFLLIPMI